jgi:hypothetical protein
VVNIKVPALAGLAIVVVAGNRWLSSFFITIVFDWFLIKNDPALRSYFSLAMYIPQIGCGKNAGLVVY